MLDAHAHIWDPSVLEYPWLESADTLKRAFLPEDFPADTPITSRVFIECDAALRHAVAEVRWVVSRRWQGLVGIVAHIDARSATLDADLASLVEEPLVRGVRASIQHVPQGYVASAGFHRGLKRLAAEALTFDACVRADQLAELCRAAEAASCTRIVIDHLGNPPVSAGFDSAEGPSGELTWKRWHCAITCGSNCPDSVRRAGTEQLTIETRTDL